MSKDRADRLRDRRTERRDDEDTDSTESSETDTSSETSETTDSSDTSKAYNTPNTSEESQPDKQDETSVRNQTHVAMYLEEQLAEDLDYRFDELNLEYRREHGEKMTKNGEFYPALARAAINDTTIREELDLDTG